MISGAAETSRAQSGFSLVEILVALLIIGVGVLATVPMFVTATHRHSDGGEAGRTAALALDRMEQLRERHYDSVEFQLGGSLDNDAFVGLAPYFDRATPGYVVRWTIANGPIANTKTITVRAIELDSPTGRPQQTTLVTARGN